MNPIGKGFLIATAVAGLVLSGDLSALAQDKAKAEPIKCAGLNDCKGMSSCKSAMNDCASFSLRVTVERDASPGSTRPEDARRGFGNLFKK